MISRILSIIVILVPLFSTFAEAGPLRRAKNRTVARPVPVQTEWKTEPVAAASHPVGIELLKTALPKERWKQVAAEYGEYFDALDGTHGGDVGRQVQGGRWAGTVPPYADWRKFKTFRLDGPEPLGKPFGKLMRNPESTPADWDVPTLQAFQQAARDGSPLSLWPESVREVSIMKQVMPKFPRPNPGASFSFNICIFR